MLVCARAVLVPLTKQEHPMRTNPPAPPLSTEDAFLEELRQRMNSAEKPMPVEEFLAYLDELQKAPPSPA
jgi:hypothetical protein